MCKTQVITKKKKRKKEKDYRYRTEPELLHSSDLVRWVPCII